MEKIPVTKPFFDDAEIEEIARALASGWVAQGPRVARFEQMVAAHEGVRFGAATTSCTTALQLAVRALGVGRGDDVIVPAFTFIATANAVACEGATPVFADVDENTFNISVNCLKTVIDRYIQKDGALINPLSGNTLRLILPVHLFGLCADIPAVNAIAKEHGLLVLEDAACALGAKIGETHEGAFGNTSCLSFHPRKSITTGEGGMVLTDDEALARRMAGLRTHGAAVAGFERHEGTEHGFLLPDFDEHGYNFRMTDIQAAMGIAQMAKFDTILRERRKRAEYYDMLLNDIALLKTPYVPAGHYHTYQSYVCALDERAVGSLARAHSMRDDIMSALAKKGIATRIGTHAVHNTGHYRKLYSLEEADFPAANRCEKLSITLPLVVSMTSGQQELVARELKQAIKAV